MVAGMYKEGIGVTQNDKTAIKWYTLSAEQGYAVAQFLLGTIFLKGEGVSQDHKTAAKWFTLSAEQGYAQLLS
tara:strand:- start:305 stop:523 length:219 start_codon:yes stop_codon:yes gene_type:complete